MKTEDACAGLITEHISVTAVISINYFPKAGNAAFLQRPDPGRQPHMLGFGVDGAAFICLLAPGGLDLPARGVDSSRPDSQEHRQAQTKRQQSRLKKAELPP